MIYVVARLKDGGEDTINHVDVARAAQDIRALQGLAGNLTLARVEADSKDELAEFRDYCRNLPEPLKW